MCGRYELHSHPAAIALLFELAHEPADMQPRYNIAPTDEVPIVRVNAHGERELVRVRWGLVPRWARDRSIGQRLINARGETAAAKPSFKMPWQHHRCLLPADGFYEWMALPRGAAGRAPLRKQPMHVGMKNGDLFGIAGLFERWRDDTGDVLDTCTIVTTEANDLLRPVHDRMPLIIEPEQFGRWLDPSSAEVGDLVAPYRSEAMTLYPVGTRVNGVKNDDATLIDRVDLPADSEGDDAPPPERAPEQESLF